EVRVAYAIGRKVGTAVVRNRVRRRLRAAVRDLDVTTGGLPGGAYLVSVGPGAAGRSYWQLRADLAAAIAAASGRRLGAAGSHRPPGPWPRASASPRGSRTAGRRRAGSSRRARTTPSTPSRHTARCGAAS